MLYQKNITPKTTFDVIVVGGGPAGICAAVSSARMGVKTLLVERYGALGGNLTLGLVGPVTGSVGSGTMLEEITRLIGGNYPNRWVHDYETAKIKLVELINAAGVQLFLQTQAIDVIMENTVISGIITASPEGISAVKADIIIDASGDGQIAFLAGAEYEKGCKEDALLQPVSLMFKLGGVDDNVAITGNNHTYDVRMPGSGFNDFCKQAAEKGELPEIVSFVRLYRTSRHGECVVNATQANGIDATKVEDIAKAEALLRLQIPEIVQFLQKHIKGFENCFLQESASTLGVRETRRILGEYILTEEDLIAGRRFDDVIVHDAYYNIDIHNPTGGGMQEFTPVRPYDIPYRCIIPRKIDNLLTAGRCISGTHRAQASYRVMSICMAIGQAAGIAAALSSQKKVYPRGLDVKLIQKQLSDCGVVLFDKS